MNKQRLYYAWTILRRIKPWYFLVLAVISAVICVFALRANNLRMVELRQAVYVADQNNGDVEGAIRALRQQVYGHMNTSLATSNNVKPPLQLKYSYDRLVAAKQAAAQSTGTSNEDIYGQAQLYCEKAIPSGFSGKYRLSCIQSFVKQRTITNPTAIDTSVPKNLYQFDFISPSWSPDLAGWSLLAAIVFFISFVFGWIFHSIIRRLVNK